MSHSRPFTVIDLFGGAGGTGWGFKQAGFKILAAVDNDPHAAATYGENLGVLVDVCDIRELAPRHLRRLLGMQKGELDVLAGCPPCQGFTRMRNSGGASDPRNDLVLRYLEFLSELRPRFAVFENVPGLLDTTHGKAFHAQLITGFRRRGYKVKQQVLEAADYGVPQRRRRVIIIAARKGFRIAFPEATHGDPRSASVLNFTLKPWVTVRQAIGHLPSLRPGMKNEQRGRLPNHVASATGAQVCDFLRRVPKNGGSRIDVPKAHWLDCHRRHSGHLDTYGRVAWDGPANTITSGCCNPSKGRFTHPTQTRALSFREAATLQGFPLSFRFYRQNIDRQIGNAVPPPMALAIAEIIKLSLTARQRPRKHPSTARIGIGRKAQSLPGITPIYVNSLARRADRASKTAPRRARKTDADCAPSWECSAVAIAQLKRTSYRAQRVTR